MILYHGSYLTVEKPVLSFSRSNLDFGKGFYTTPIKEQAVSWSARFKRNRGKSMISLYEVDEYALRNSTAVLEFKEYSDEWLDFIVSCRRGKHTGGYDVVIGGVANDKVFDTIQLFLDELVSKDEAIKRLRYEKPNIQYCFRRQAVIDGFLKFVSSEEY
ncbi:MAG: DUF3990 domain-containing protein [Oscillospiraceae bacterium]|nr:DUF3990 domain-containing protein [Oscillospiraceae bacterium]